MSSSERSSSVAVTSNTNNEEDTLKENNNTTTTEDSNSQSPPEPIENYFKQTPVTTVDSESSSSDDEEGDDEQEDVESISEEDFVYIKSQTPEKNLNVKMTGSLSAQTPNLPSNNSSTTLQQQQSKSGGFFENFYIFSSQKNEYKRIQLFERCLGKAPKFELYEQFVAKHPRKFRAMMRQGIPTQELRRFLWQKMAEANELSKQYNPELFKKLSQLEGNQFADSIEKDVHRTYPQYLYFSERNGKGQTELANILRAYAFFDKQVGYVQGMPFVVGFLQMHMPEEEAFWMFVQMCSNRRYAMKDVYRPGLPRLRLLMYSIEQLIKLRIPDIYEHLQKECVTPEMYASSFLLTLCTNRFEFDVSERLWDIFLNEGWKMIMRLIVGIFKLHRERILKLGTADIIPFIYEQCNKLDVETMLKAAFSVKLRTKTINQFAQQYEAHMLSEEEKQALNKHRQQMQVLLQNRTSQSSINVSPPPKKTNSLIMQLGELVFGTFTSATQPSTPTKQFDDVHVPTNARSIN